jgi:hypothetical protein
LIETFDIEYNLLDIFEELFQIDELATSSFDSETSNYTTPK